MYSYDTLETRLAYRGNSWRRVFTVILGDISLAHIRLQLCPKRASGARSLLKVSPRRLSSDRPVMLANCAAGSV